jgi:hypothetical protein
MAINNTWCFHSRLTQVLEWFSGVRGAWGSFSWLDFPPYLSLIVFRSCISVSHSEFVCIPDPFFAQAGPPPALSLLTLVILGQSACLGEHLMERPPASWFPSLADSQPHGPTDVLPGFVLIACFKNSTYPPTVQIIIFQVASNRDYFWCCLPWRAQLSWKIWGWGNSPFLLF